MTRRFSEVEILKILDGAESRTETIHDYCARQGITEQTFYRWRRERRSPVSDPYEEVRRLKSENSKLKRMFAECKLKLIHLQENNANILISN